MSHGKYTAHGVQYSTLCAARLMVSILHMVHSTGRVLCKYTARGVQYSTCRMVSIQHMVHSTDMSHGDMM